MLTFWLAACQIQDNEAGRGSAPATGGRYAPRTSSSAKSEHGLARNKLSAETAQALERAETDPYWLKAKETVDTRVSLLVSQHQDELQRGLRFAKILKGDLKRKWIALTFDDGPHPAYTPQILSILRKHHVKATFFLVGEMAEKYPELVKAEDADGHSIANHTYHHVSLPKIPSEYVATEIKACGEVLQSITGRAPRLFRPPGGEYNDQVAQTIEALGYKLVLWTNDPGDYASPGRDVILKRTLSKITNGGIILIHDGIQQTVDVLPALLDYLKAQGYELVTVDEMLKPRPRYSTTEARIEPTQRLMQGFGQAVRP